MTNMTEFYSRIYWLNKSDSLTTPLGKTNLNHMDSAIKTLDGRTVELYTEAVRLDTTKADKNQLKGMVTNWQIDDRTGIVTLTKYDGTKVSINTALNQLAVNFDYDAVNQQLVITQTDGTQKIVDMSALITQYEFLDTDTVSFFVDENGKVSAKVKEGSIEEKHLQPNYLADIKVEVAKAQGYATDAQESAGNAAYDAKLSQSYAVGGSGIRENEDVDNAREYAKKAKESADTAQELVGGKFIPADEKGAAGGVASLDNDGKVPKAQLPDDIGSGTSNESKSILNMFDEQPASLNINMSDPSIINRITYFMATSSVTEGKPPIDCMIINLSWYSGYGGAQLGVGMYSNPRMFIRAFNNGSGGWDNKWLEFLTTGNVTDNGYIDNSNPPELPVDFRLPYAGTPYSGNVSGIYRDLYSFVKKHKSGFYTVLFDDKWYNVLSLRHRNGYADGENYGLIIYCRMTDLSGDLCWARQAGVDKNETVRILLDSKNYSSYIGSLRDKSNGNPIYLNYGASAIIPNATRPWLALWVNNGDNTYDLKATNIANFIQAKLANGYYGMACGTYLDNVWIRTTSLGLLPYQSGGRGSGHQQLGTDSWYFLKSYIDQMFGVTLDLSGTITSRVNTNTYINGAKGEKVAINMIAAAGFNMIARVKSTNGQFIFGCYNGDFQLYYISDDIVNASTNSYTNGITLMNENGHMIPLNNNSHDIGTSTYRYRYLHVVTIYTSRLNSIYSSNTSIYLGSNVSISSDTDIMINSSTGRTGINNAVTLTCVNSNNIRIGVRHKAYSSSALTYFESDRDNMTVLGGASTRWKQIYAVTSSITTSDRREKKNISYMGSYSNEDTYMSDDTLQSFIRGLLPCIYLRIDGDTGRPHHGLISQDVEELLKKLGIKDHAGFIKSPKTETIEIEEEVEEEYTDEDGNKKTRTVIQKREEPREIPGEYIYGLRYEEFIADIVRFVQIQDEKIEEQEKIIHEQQKELDNQREEINALKARLERLEALLLY